MTTESSTPKPPPAVAPAGELPPRLRRTLELVYDVEGVVAARVWQWPGRVAIAVRGAGGGSSDLLTRVESAVSGLRDPEETWEFGWLEE